MATQLISIVRFAGLAVGVPVALPHGLNQDGRALVPDVVLPSAGGFTIAADATNVTATRTVEAASGAVDVLVFQLHTVLRNFGPTTPPPGNLPSGSLAPQPFIVEPGTLTPVATAGRYALPDKWSQNDIAASQTNVALAQNVSQLFDTTKAIRAGSLIGFSTRIDSTITAGTLTIELTINGAGTGFTLVHTSGSNPTGGEATQAAGLSPFVAGDVIGARITTNGAFAMNDADGSIDVWIDADTD